MRHRKEFSPSLIVILFAAGEGLGLDPAQAHDTIDHIAASIAALTNFRMLGETAYREFERFRHGT